MSGYVLVHPTLHVGELPLQFIFGRASHAYFVGHENESGFLSGEPVERLFHRFKCLLRTTLRLEEEIGTPQRDAIYQHHPAGHVVLAEFLFFFNVRPLGSPCLPVLDDSLAKLFVPHSGGGHVDGAEREAERQFLGIRTFARTRASRDKYDSFHVLGSMMILCKGRESI